MHLKKSSAKIAAILSRPQYVNTEQHLLMVLCSYQLRRIRVISTKTQQGMKKLSQHDGVINGNTFRVTGLLCVEFTDYQWFPAQRPVTLSFVVFFDLRLNKRLGKLSCGWWFETPSCPLWVHIVFRNSCILGTISSMRYHGLEVHKG